ncbi:MAG: acyltransferase family protein [Mucilaginibacter sp.]
MTIFNTKSILKEKRRVWIDTDKGISILLVGFGHCLLVMQNHGLALNSYPLVNYISVFLYGFRMPLFFIISGIFISGSLKRKGLIGYASYRADTILYPLLIWGFIEVSFQLLAGRFTNNSVSPLNYVNLLIDARKTGHFWYLNALFFIGIIYAVCKAYLKMKPGQQLALGGLLYAISSYIHINNLYAGSLTDIFEYYLFFAIGDVITNVVLSEKNFNRFASFKIFFPLLAVFLILQYRFTFYNLHGGAEGINYVEHKMPFFFLLEALVGCTISMNFSFLLQKYNALRFLRVIGFHSLYIYCLQIIVMTIARIFLLNILNITYVPVLIGVIWSAGIFIPIAFYNFCMKYGMWWLFTFRKPKKQEQLSDVNNAVTADGTPKIVTI